MERGNEWSVRVAAAVGRRVAHFRKQADLTGVMLSARCAELGLPLDRNVLAKLENGHRRSVTVDEVFVLAAALGVAPALLLFGVGAEATVEALPERQVPPFRAVQWFGGEGPVPEPGSEAHLALGAPGAARVLEIYREHDRAAAEELRAGQTAHELEKLTVTAGTEAQRAALRVAVETQDRAAREFRDIGRRLREEATRKGWEPPAVILPVSGGAE